MVIEDYLYNLLSIYYKSPKFIKRFVGVIYNIIPNKFRYGKNFSEFKTLLIKSKKWSDSEIEKFQLQEINKILKICVNNVPYYKRTLKNLKLPLQSINEFKEKVPFITKEDVRNNPYDFLNKKIKKSELIKISTGGTTGEPLLLFLHKGFNRTKEIVHMSNQWGRVDYKQGDLRFVIRSRFIKNKATNDRYTFDYINNRIFVSSFHLGIQDIELYVTLINKYKPKYFHVYPSVLTIVANTIINHNLILTHFPKAILCGSENIFPHQIKLFEKIFQCKVFRWYGLGEEASLAGSCEHSHSYHPFPTYSYTEIVDNEGFSVSVPGDKGEIVGTPFFNYAMPLLRYRTQDYAIYESNRCEKCLRPGPIFSEVEGRAQEVVFDKNGVKKSLGPYIFGIHDDFWANFSQIQFFQDELGKLSIITQSLSLSKEKQIEYIKKVFKKRFLDFELSYEPNGNILKSKRGKHKYLIQKIIQDETNYTRA